VGRDIIDRRGGIAAHEEFAGYVDEAQRSDDNKQQVPQSGDSSWVTAYVTVPPIISGCGAPGVPLGCASAKR
jgi:hypothetical protein